MFAREVLVVVARNVTVAEAILVNAGRVLVDAKAILVDAGAILVDAGAVAINGETLSTRGRRAHQCYHDHRESGHSMVLQ